MNAAFPGRMKLGYGAFILAYINVVNDMTAIKSSHRDQGLTLSLTE